MVHIELDEFTIYWREYIHEKDLGYTSKLARHDGENTTKVQIQNAANINCHLTHHKMTRCLESICFRIWRSQ
jgi:hypothetical protein